jgi:hypothetical protein
MFEASGAAAGGASIHHPSRRGPPATHPGMVYGPAQFSLLLIFYFYFYFYFFFVFQNLSIIKSRRISNFEEISKSK